MAPFSEIHLRFETLSSHHVVAGTMQRDDTLHFSFCLTKYSVSDKRIILKIIKKKKEKNHDDW